MHNQVERGTESGQAGLTTGAEAGAEVEAGAPQPLDVSAVFGKPYTAGDRTVIPVARVSYAVGSGTKGGGRAMTARPVAVVEIGGGRVRVQQIVSPLPIILGGMLVGAWNVYWIARAVREWSRKQRGG
jgi:hypothetical protein